MALQALPTEQVAPTVQALLAFLDRGDVNIPGNLLESIVSGKSLLRALASGQLVLAQNIQPQPAKGAEAPPPAAADVKKPPVKKKKAA